MLNTKYFVNQQGQAYTNPDALGSAWFVKGIQWAKDPAAEMNALTTLNAKDTAVMNLANQKSMSGLNGYDSAASIKLVSKSNDVLQYQANTKNTQLAVFSEIYYDKGWKAYIDNKETPILKSNYLFASNSVDYKKVQRYQESIKSYLTFVDSFKNSKFAKEAESFYLSSLKELEKLKKT